MAEPEAPVAAAAVKRLPTAAELKSRILIDELLANRSTTREVDYRIEPGGPSSTDLIPALQAELKRRGLNHETTVIGPLFPVNPADDWLTFKAGHVETVTVRFGG